MNVNVITTKEELDTLASSLDLCVIKAHCYPSTKEIERYLKKLKREYYSDVNIVDGTCLKKFYKNTDHIKNFDIFIIIDLLSIECDEDGIDAFTLRDETGLDIKYLNTMIDELR